MAEILTTQTPKRRNSNSNGSVPLTDIIYRTLHYWPWVLLSLFICVGSGVIYLLRTPNVYTTTASILIKDNSAGKSTGGEDFSEFGLFKNKTNIQNEITTLKSTDLMDEVVRRLGLDVNYYIPGRFHDTVAYGSNLPIKVSMPDFNENGSASFNINITADNNVRISNLKSDGITYKDDTYEGALNDTITTGIGPIIVFPTNVYSNGNISIEVEKSPLVSTAASYAGRLSVSMKDDKSSVINLVITDQSTQRAQEVLNTLIGVYNEYWIRDKNQIAVSTSNFINERLGVIESELGSVDSDISSYKSQNLVPDINAAATMYMSKNQEAQAQLLDLSNQLQMTRYIRSYLTSDTGNDQLLPANTGTSSGSIQTLISEYNTNLLYRNSLLEKASEKNPLVKQLDEQLSAQRSAIIRTIDNEIVNLNNQIKALRGTEAQITSQLASNPTIAKNLLSVERQQKVKESLYLFLLQKREENELSQAFTAYNTRIVHKPSSFGPTSPNKTNILGISFLLGLAIPFGIIFIKEINNTKVRGRKDITDLTVPFLGEIPQYTPKDKNIDDEKRIVVKAGKRDIINEAFRVLRTNVEFMCNYNEGIKVIAVTSFNPGSGKSFISVNLAKSMALKDKKTLVIDGDMRHGSTSAYIGSVETGLANYLGGAVADVQSLIVKDETCDSLFVLPVGSIPPNPTELLESPRFAEMLKLLRNQFDFIIIDCPPIEVVADAQIIDKYADRTFFIIRAGLMERSMLPELDRLYDEKKYTNMAFILNGTRNDQGRYGYSHSYRYGYGYGYGYGYNYGTEGHKKKNR